VTQPLRQDLSTPVGTARVVLERPAAGGGRGRLVLGHGAGGGPEAPDLLAARDAALDLGLEVVRVEQPWRVLGRRVAEAPDRLDRAWCAVLAALQPHGGLLVVGGRSAGARVACRTARATGADAVLALAFPLHPPGRPGVSRLDELLRAGVPRLVVQGARDAFGVPPAGPGVRVHVVEGADHAFSVRRRDGRAATDVTSEVRSAVGGWLGGLLERRQTLT